MKNLFVWICLSVLLFAACNSSKSGNNYFTVQGTAQGTYYRVTYEDTVNLKTSFDSLLQEFDTVFNNYMPESMISRINANDTTIRINQQFKYFFEKSKFVSNITNGAFDITVAPIVNAWSFGYKNDSILPSKSQIDSLKEFVGMDKVTIVDDRIIKSDLRVQIIGNAIAQGYSTDLIADFLDKRGVKNYLIDVGCEMRSKGHNAKGSVWTIGITRPQEMVDTLALEDSYDVAVLLDNKSLATSGNYRKFYEENGQKYSHTINPKTGLCVRSNLLSTTIIADECIDADAIATACMVMGLEESKKFLLNHPEYDALLIYDEKGSYKTFKTKNIMVKE